RAGDRSHARRAEQSLDDDAIAPLAIELAVALVHTHDPEAASLVENEARGVLRENPRHDLPEPALAVGATECFERHTTGAGAARGARDVDRMFGDARIGAPVAIRPSTRPGDGLAVALDDYRRETIRFLDELRLDLFGCARLRLEGRDPVRDAFVVDHGDSRGVSRSRQSSAIDDGRHRPRASRVGAGRYAGVGLRARMNALMNLPSTTGAMAFALMPSRSRNACASSVL